MLQVQSTHSGHTHISPGRCRQRHPLTRTPRCWCCSYSTPPSSRFHSDTPRSHTLRGLRTQSHWGSGLNAKTHEYWWHSCAVTHLRRAPHGSEHRSNCHTRSKVHRWVQNWTHDTHTAHSSTAPDRCISRTCCLRGSYPTKRFPHYTRTVLPGTPAGTRTRRTGKPLGPRCTGCCLLQEVAGSHTSKETPVPPLDCPASPPVWGRSAELLTGTLGAPRTRWTLPEEPRRHPINIPKLIFPLCHCFPKSIKNTAASHTFALGDVFLCYEQHVVYF